MKFRATQNGIAVHDDNGVELGRVEQVTLNRGNSAYDSHRRAKGDNFEYVHKSNLSKDLAEAIFSNAKAPHNLHPLLRYALRDHGINA